MVGIAVNSWQVCDLRKPKKSKKKNKIVTNLLQTFMLVSFRTFSCSTCCFDICKIATMSLISFETVDNILRIFRILAITSFPEGFFRSTLLMKTSSLRGEWSLIASRMASRSFLPRLNSDFSRFSKLYSFSFSHISEMDNSSIENRVKRSLSIP